MSKLSIVIPVWSGTPVLTEMHIELCKSVKDDCDELIVCEDGPWQPELQNLASAYLLSNVRLGHAQNLQRGINYATGDFIGVLDADVVIKEGSMRNLCNEGKFTQSYLLGPTHKKGFIIWCSVTDAKLYKKYPMPTDTELLDNWAQSIPDELIFGSMLVQYEHNSGIIYSEWKRVHGG